jgi:hypothetical protein
MVAAAVRDIELRPEGTFSMTNKPKTKGAKMNIKVAILGVLTACGSYALKPALLKNEAEIWVGKQVSEPAFRTALKQLKSERKVAARRDPHNNVVRYFIPGAAKAEAA